MQGFFSYDSAGPIINKNVFNQLRFIEAMPDNNRLCFYPTEVTH